MVRRDEIALIGFRWGAWDEAFAWSLSFGGALGRQDEDRDVDNPDADVDAAELLLYERIPQLEERYYQALSAYYQHELWKPAMPRGMALNEQPYPWKRAIECVRAAHNRHQREEQIKEARLREMDEA